MKKILFTLLFSSWAVVSFAQPPVVNPTVIQWDAPDHAITTRYEIGYFFPGAVSPFTTVSVDKASVTSLDADTFTASLPKPILGTFVAEMKACGTGADSTEVCSDWSDISNSFKLTPKKPQTLGVR